jgi:hypothetical protein
MAGGISNAIGLVINSTNPLSSLNGGTGNSNSFNILLGGALTTAGALITSGGNSITFTSTGTTNVTLPTSGTLVNTGVTSLSSLSTVGTISTGVWQGTIVGSTYGGTGVNNGSNTITLGGNINTAGAFSTTGANSLIFNTTGSTNVTLPTSGTLVTSSGVVSITDATSTTVTMVDNAPINVYIADNATLVTLTLPTTIVQGHIFKIVGKGVGGWKVAQNAGQSITLENNGTVVSTTSGTSGFISSNLSCDCIEFSSTTANTTLTVSSSYGNFNYN